MKRLSILFCTLFFSLVFGAESSLIDDRSQELEKCLLECYRIDDATVSRILEDFSILNDEYNIVVDSFIVESRKLNIYAGEPSSVVGPALPLHHSVLFENPYIRISRAVTKCGEQELPQRHPWKTLMVVIQSSQFYSLREDGSSYEDNWPAGTYLLEPSLDLLSCKNIGPSDYYGLSFEMKSVE